MENEKETFHYHPFGYDFDKKDTYTSFMTQREASYTKPFDEVYNKEDLDEKELAWRAWTGTIEVPTPPIKKIDGYKSEEEIEG